MSTQDFSYTGELYYGENDHAIKVEFSIDQIVGNDYKLEWTVDKTVPIEFPNDTLYAFAPVVERVAVLTADSWQNAVAGLMKEVAESVEAAKEIMPLTAE